MNKITWIGVYAASVAITFVAGLVAGTDNTVRQKLSRQPLNVSVVRVVDGDTIRITAPFLPAPLKPQLLLRINKIDTPEKGKLAQCDKERARSNDARKFTEKTINSGKVVVVEIHKWDKYGGRVLGDVVIDGKLLSKLLVDNNHAIAYNGGRKTQDWCK